MSTTYKSISPYELEEGAIRLIGQDWMLITAGTLEDYNTMTASWGGLGELWGRPVSFCFIRPQRYTYSFMERFGTFTLSFFDAAYRPALNLCGSRSGRDINKAQITGLTPVQSPAGAVYFEQARLVIECRKCYQQDIDPQCFAVPGIVDEIYTTKDFHRMYIGEILQVLQRA